MLRQVARLILPRSPVRTLGVGTNAVRTACIHQQQPRAVSPTLAFSGGTPLRKAWWIGTPALVLAVDADEEMPEGSAKEPASASASEGAAFAAGGGGAAGETRATAAPWSDDDAYDYDSCDDEYYDEEEDEEDEDCRTGGGANASAFASASASAPASADTSSSDPTLHPSYFKDVIDSLDPQQRQEFLAERDLYWSFVKQFDDPEQYHSDLAEMWKSDPATVETQSQHARGAARIASNTPMYTHNPASFPVVTMFHHSSVPNITREFALKLQHIMLSNQPAVSGTIHQCGDPALVDGTSRAGALFGMTKVLAMFSTWTLALGSITYYDTKLLRETLITPAVWYFSQKETRYYQWNSAFEATPACAFGTYAKNPHASELADDYAPIFLINFGAPLPTMPPPPPPPLMFPTAIQASETTCSDLHSTRTMRVALALQSITATSWRYVAQPPTLFLLFLSSAWFFLFFFLFYVSSAASVRQAAQS